MEWKEYTLNDVCTKIFSGGTPSTNVADYWGGALPWLSSGETGQRYISRTDKTITEEGATHSSTRYATRKSTVVASAGQGYTRGQASYLEIDTYVNQSIIVLQPNEDVLDSLYLYFNIDNRYKELRQLSDGTSTRGSLSGRIMKELSIKLPPLEDQRRIANILSSLDRKIELNNKINAQLEEMAQAIFKSWFVDFEPFKDGKFVDSELGLIPEGWKVGTLSDVANIVMGQSPTGSTLNECGDGIIFYQGCSDFTFRFPNIRVFTTSPTRLAESNSVLFSVRAPVGAINMAKETCCIGRGIAAIKSNNDCDSYIYYLMKSLHTIFDSYNGEGTVFGSINKKTLEGINVVLPHDEIIKKFNNVIESIDKRITILCKEVEELSTLRDTLLPKLMNCEIEI